MNIFIALHEERFPLAAFRSREDAEAWIAEQDEKDYTFSIEEVALR